jgi:hypothetical protein
VGVGDSWLGRAEGPSAVSRSGAWPQGLPLSLPASLENVYESPMGPSWCLRPSYRSALSTGFPWPPAGPDNRVGSTCSLPRPGTGRDPTPAALNTQDPVSHAVPRGYLAWFSKSRQTSWDQGKEHLGVYWKNGPVEIP